MRHPKDRKSTRLNSSHTEIYTLSLHDALPICAAASPALSSATALSSMALASAAVPNCWAEANATPQRSEEHTSELQSHRDLHSFPTRRSSDLRRGFAGFEFRDGFVEHGPSFGRCAKLLGRGKCDTP